MRIEILPRAEQDIIRQFRYYLVDQDAPAAAFRFREAVIASIQQLKSFPGAGSPCRVSLPGLRSWPVKGFEEIRVYYQESTESVRVIRVLHGKRDVRAILRRER